MIDRRFAPYALTLIRVALGAMFVAHALLKFFVFSMPGFAGFLGQVGLPAFLAWPIFLAELVGGLMLIAGVYARWVSVALLPILLGAFVIHFPNGWLFSAPNGGWEFPAFLVVASVAHILAGDGAFAAKPSTLPFPGMTHTGLQAAE